PIYEDGIALAPRDPAEVLRPACGRGLVVARRIGGDEDVARAPATAQDSAAEIDHASKIARDVKVSAGVHSDAPGRCAATTAPPARPEMRTVFGLETGDEDVAASATHEIAAAVEAHCTPDRSGHVDSRRSVASVEGQ